LTIRIILGGPPHSGKSTLAERIARAFQDQGVNAEAIDLDLWSPTLEAIRGEITPQKRESLKRKNITVKEAKEAAIRFREKSKVHDIVIGDAPGGISEESEHIYKSATHGIIVCSEERRAELDQWTSFFKRIHLELIVLVISGTEGEDTVLSNGVINAFLVNLDGTPSVTPGTRILVSHLRKRLGI